MPQFAEPSPAKINLSLKILGKRRDGYHELESLVVFGREAADVVTLDTESAEALAVSGPFAAKLEGENILEKTLARVHAAAPHAKLGRVSLEKNLPVAAGLGGGSANAAALLRAIDSANPGLALDWHDIAKSLGADVPVCLESRASFMSGIGDRVKVLPSPLPELYAVLANPRVAVPADKTARVFRALAAAPLDAPKTSPSPDVSSREAVLSLMARDGNDLEAPAISVIPEISAVLGALAALDGTAATALSGAGPTAFALFFDRTGAEKGAARLRAHQPDWWIAVTSLT